jgi:hypothetical protein
MSVYEIYWRNPVIGFPRVFEVASRADAEERAAHYAEKYGRMAGYEPAQYRAKPEEAHDGS